ncbi:MAG: gliding motility-associated C-terminal domain-containing protein [Flavobacteriales bacterium]|jgi:gliding motility-associated-like protein|nr:MAG: gliding motility-associated C-terminal domain-containing protein [Flavobacteriales bacterium]
MRGIILSGALLAQAIAAVAHDHAHGAAGRGLEFHENKGQWPQQALYRAMTPGGAVFIEPSAFTYVLRSGGMQHARPKDEPFEPYREHAFKAHFVGGAALAHRAEERQPHYANYFIGDDPSKWAGGVGIYGGVRLEEVYPGIDLHVHGERGLKYDWVVAPGADPGRIGLRYEGHEGLEVRDGMAYIATTAGTVIEQRPVAWSESDGRRIPVSCAFIQEGDQVRYAFPDGYDPSLTLVIDPVVTFSSYVGSFADNFGFTATYDDDGHLYGAGIVFGMGYPVTTGVQQASFQGGTIDIGVSKFTPSGDALVWSTYLGGSLNEAPHSLVVNSLDELYVLGTTGSANFPATAGAHDATFNGGSFISLNASYGFSHDNGVDVVVAHLSADATALIGSTYVGGAGNDGVNSSFNLAYNYGDPFRGEIALDAQERPVVATCTGSTNMPVTAGAPQQAFGGGALDGFVFRLDAGLTALDWATYLGGAIDDAAYGVQFNSAGEVYVTGGTSSANLVFPGPAFDPSANGGVDGFIARYAAEGTVLLSGTYLGTSAYDQCYFVQIDAAGLVYVVGQTSGAYPVSPGVYANPSGSQFIHKLSADLSASQWSTRIGSTGTEDISPSAFLVSDCGQIYFSGWGGTTNNVATPNFSTTIGLPVTADAYQPTTDGSDFYLMVLNADASSLAYATFFGGTAAEHVDGGTSRFDKDGIVYQAVCAGCGFGATTFPTTPGAWSSTDNGMNCNLGVFKIDFEQNVQVNIEASISSALLCLEDPIVLTAVGTADEWLWDLGDGSPASTEATLAHLYAAPGTYTIMLVGTATGLCVAIDTAYAEITVVPPADLQPAFSAVPTGDCDAFSAEFFNSSTGSSIYLWDFGDGSGSAQTNPVHPYAGPGDYTVTLGIVDATCADTAYASQVITIGLPGIGLDLESPLGLCDGGSVLLNAGSGYDSYAWSTGDASMMITVDEPGSYVVVVTDGFCTGADTVVVAEPVTYEPLLDRTICPGQDATLTPPFVPQSIAWSTGSQAASIAVDGTGEYWYTATDPLGCTVTDTVRVTIATLGPGRAFLPNVFTPNGDGHNEVFVMEGIEAADFQMDVYNRWGQRVFASNTSTYGWNGKLENNGDPVPDGTYYVVATYKEYCKEGGPVTVSGHVTLLR